MREIPSDRLEYKNSRRGYKKQSEDTLKNIPQIDLNEMFKVGS